MKKLKNYSVPHLLHIETTYKCNSNCIFCYNPNRDSSIDYERLDNIVDAVYRAKIPHVYLIGGEPSMLEVNKLNEYINKLSEFSSVTIVTNAIQYLEGLSTKLACIGVPIHGNEKTHEFLNNNKGSYRKIIANIKKYVECGFDVRCIPVLMNVNYDQIYSIIGLAKDLKMESVFVDRYEEGGIGSQSQILLKPTIEQFKIALSQMIKGRDDFNIPVGWGTAIPYCLDERLLKENMCANCGVGVTFCAVNPYGDLRICNQSNIVYGNVLKDDIIKIWNSKDIDEFRDLSWVSEPCKSCEVLQDCVCGCKVDQRCSDKYCIDYAIRNSKPEINIKTNQLNLLDNKSFSYPEMNRRFIRNSYAKLSTYHKEFYIVTRYQTVEFDKENLDIIHFILFKTNDEEEVIRLFSNHYDVEEIRELISKLLLIGALDLI